MASGSGTNNENEESHNEEHFVLIENEPPSVDTRLMMLIEQVAKTNEQIAMLMANQGQPNVGTQVVVNPKETDPNAIYDKFRKRGATEFYGNEGAIKADDWLEHIGDVFETITCNNKQRVVLASSMFREAANVWWKSIREPFKTMPNATIWETFKKQFRRKFVPEHVRRKKQNEFLTLQQNQMTMADYVHTFLQLSKYAEDLINTEEKKVDKFIGGFVSIDCGGTDDFIDDLDLEWVSDNQFIYGTSANLSVPSEKRKQYTTLRYFPADNGKYCYRFSVEPKTRYLVRASFLYGNFNNINVYPKFDIYLGATHWSTIVISDAETIEVKELILLAYSPPVSVCLSNATTGQPFISTLELRQFYGSVYYTDYETQFFLSLSARINFGSVSDDPIRYPDDPFDRIWESDSLKKVNYLVDVAAGTEKVSTNMSIDVNRDERPPVKVMQTAVVGRNGTLTYRLNLDGFPGFGWAFFYFAEIEDLGPTETRTFGLHIPGEPEYSKAPVNIQENARGRYRYRLYEPGSPNMSLPFVFSFAFMKTSDSTMGPMLNAMEINKYLQINYGSQDATLISNLASRYPQADWAQEGGDPCLPVPSSWAQCNSDPQPKIVSIILSGKNLTGNIPSELTELTGLVELWIDGNSLTGPIPDFSRCPNLKKIHLENNRLTGAVPSSLVDLQNLSELFLQNNLLSGALPRGLLNKNLNLNYSGNINLHFEKSGRKRIEILIASVVGASVLVMVAIACFFIMYNRNKRDSNEGDVIRLLPPQKCDAAPESAHCFTLLEIEQWTFKFEKQIGSGGYGLVYYGNMEDGKEIAVKVLSNDSHQGKREFSNEVSLLSRIHHRNLIAFIGYCPDEGRNILVYEFMHNGTLKQHLYGPLVQDRTISWIKRLEIAEDAAKGIEYLHTGCVPAVIHRDLKPSNILLDKNMRAKVSDFGLSKLTVEGSSHVSSMVKGTVGYLDPEYYSSQQLTDKSDVYSFGVILLQLISGREAISTASFGMNFRNVVDWAKSHVESGNIQGIIDPSLRSDFDIQSVWKVADKAMMCIQPYGRLRPSISEVLKEIQEAISIERGTELAIEGNSDTLSKSSEHSPLHAGSPDLGICKPFVSLDEHCQPHDESTIQ